MLYLPDRYLDEEADRSCSALCWTSFVDQSNTDGAHLLGCGTIFLFDLFAFVWEGPLAVERLRLFSDGFRHFVDLEIFKHVYAKLAGTGQIDVSVVVKVGGNELSTGAGGAVDRECDAREDGISCAIADLHTVCTLRCTRGGLCVSTMRDGLRFGGSQLRFGRQFISVNDDRIV